MTGDLPVRVLSGVIAAPDGTPLDRLKLAWLAQYTSPATRDAYGRDVDQWLAFCAEHAIDPLQVRRVHGDVYARTLDSGPQPMEPRSLKRKLSALSSFYAYLLYDDIVEANPFGKGGVRRPRVEYDQSETTALTEDEAEALIGAADKDYPSTRYRSAALVRMLLHLGVRVTEALDVCVEDFGFSRGHRTVKVRMKGQKTRARNLPPSTAAAVDEYLEWRAAEAGVEVASLSGPVFVTSTGQRWTRGEAYKLVQRLAKFAGLEAKVTPHSLRHTYVTVVVERGAKLQRVKNSVGHASLKTTEGYMHAVERVEDDPSQIAAAVLG